MAKINIDIIEEAKARQQNTGAAQAEAQAVNASNQAKSKNSKESVDLRKKIEDLVTATRKNIKEIRAEIKVRSHLIKNYDKLSKSQKKVANGMSDITNKGRLLSNSFATMRSKLLLLSFGYTMFAQKIINVVDAYGVQIGAEKRLGMAMSSNAKINSLQLEDMKHYAAQLQRTTGISDEMTLSAMGMLSTFHNIGDKAMLEATKQVQNIAVFMNDGKVSTESLKAEAMRLGKALNDPITGLSMLNRVGISFTKQQQEQIKALQESGQLWKAQGLILEVVNSQFKDQASLQDYQQAVRALSGAWGDFQERVGQKLVPMLTRLVTALTTMLENLNVGKVIRWMVA